MSKIDPPNFVAPDPFVLAVNVRAADIDDFGHVNNVVYLGWIARAAWAHSKALGFDFNAYREVDCGFVVTRHEIDYRTACPPETTALVGTWITANDRALAPAAALSDMPARDRHNIGFCHERFCNDKNFHRSRMPYADGICRWLSGAARAGADVHEPVVTSL